MKKILVKIEVTLLKILKEELDNALLKRDAFLDNAIRHEVEALNKEITEPNSERAYKYILKALSENDLKAVNLNLSYDTVEILDAACKKYNIPRDAFINRLVLLITAGQKVIDIIMPVFDKIDVSPSEYEIYSSEGVEWFYYRPNTIDSIKEFVKISPLFVLREVLNMYYESDDCDLDSRVLRHGFYTQPYNPDMLKGDIFGIGHNEYEKIVNLSGFNVCLDDELITVYEKQTERKVDDEDTDDLLTFLAELKQEDRSVYKKPIINS